MENYTSIWDMYQKKGMSRRSFIKTCTAMTAMLGLSPSMLSDVVEAAEKRLPVVIWMHGMECTGCTESFIRSAAPLPTDVLINMISLEYDDTLAAAQGEPFEKHLDEVVKAHYGNYFLVVEGATPTSTDGGYCMIGGENFLDKLKTLAAGAKAIITYGSCSSWGGIQAARPNPTQSVEIDEIITNKPIIKVPGCPPIPEVMTGVLSYYTLFGNIPPLDSRDCPSQFFGNRIHDTCYRRAFFNAGMFADSFDDEGAKSGWCLYKLGCRGPETYSSCGSLRWWQGMSYPIQSGFPCIGCTAKNFWDNGPLYDRLPVYAGIQLGNVDKIATMATGAMAVGITAHLATSAIQKKKRKIKERKERQEALEKQQAEKMASKEDK